MYEINIHIKLNSSKMNCDVKNAFQKIIDISHHELYNLTWHISGDSIEKYQIRYIVDTVKTLFFHKNVLIHNCIYLKNLSISSDSYKLLKKYNFSIMYTRMVNEKTLNELKKHHISFVCMYSFEDDFRQSKAEEEEIYYDYKMISGGLSPPKCYFNSCIGRTLSIETDASISACPFHSNIPLQSTDKIAELNDVFGTEPFFDYISKSFQKRKKCKSRCEDFEYCKGGCPAKIGFCPKLERGELAEDSYELLKFLKFKKISDMLRF